MSIKLWKWQKRVLAIVFCFGMFKEWFSSYELSAGSSFAKIRLLSGENKSKQFLTLELPRLFDWKSWIFEKVYQNQRKSYAWKVPFSRVKILFSSVFANFNEAWLVPGRRRDEQSFGGVGCEIRVLESFHPTTLLFWKGMSIKLWKWQKRVLAIVFCFGMFKEWFSSYELSAGSSFAKIRLLSGENKSKQFLTLELPRLFDWKSWIFEKVYQNQRKSYAWKVPFSRVKILFSSVFANFNEAWLVPGRRRDEQSFGGVGCEIRVLESFHPTTFCFERECLSNFESDRRECWQ